MNKNYSQQALQDFLDHAARSGYMAKATAQGRKTATDKLLSVLQGDEASDLRNLDIEDVAARFANRHKTEYTARTLRVYKSRAKSALTDFIAWVDDPSGFKPSVKRINRRSADRQEGKAQELPKAAGENDGPVPVHVDRGLTGTTSKTFSIPIPVREGVMVEITGLPRDLKPSEAQKISAVVTAYAIEEDK